MFTFSYVNRYTKNHNCPVSSSFILSFSGAPHPEAHRLRARRAHPPGSGPLHPPHGLDCGGGRVLRGGRGGSGALARRQRAPRGFAGASRGCGARILGFPFVFCRLLELSFLFHVGVPLC